MQQISLALGCDSEWPYEVTETRRSSSARPAAICVAIVNGRMRSLKHLAQPVSDGARTGVAIVNGRMRSLKHEQRNNAVDPLPRLR